MNTRIYVEKKHGFDIEATHLLEDILLMLNLTNIKNIRVINTYDIFNIEEEVFEKSKAVVFSEPPCDNLYTNFPLDKDDIYFAVEYLPGQFDKRANSAIECLNLLDDCKDVDVKTGKIICVEPSAGDKCVSLCSRIVKMKENENETLLLVEKVLLQTQYSFLCTASPLVLVYPFVLSIDVI